MITDHEPDHLYWRPEPAWTGQTAHIIASGPSATAELIESLRGRNVIVINSTALAAPWAPVWFFMDWAVLLARRDGSFISRSSPACADRLGFASRFRGRVITTARQVKEALPDKVCLLRCARMDAFPPVSDAAVRKGRCSGQTAISLAVAMGASKVVLHGFDMRIVDGREHHHDEYAGQKRNAGVYDRDFIPAFNGWHAQALAAGVSIVNATPESALKEFPMLPMSALE